MHNFSAIKTPSEMSNPRVRQNKNTCKWLPVFKQWLSDEILQKVLTSLARSNEPPAGRATIRQNTNIAKEKNIAAI